MEQDRNMDLTASRKYFLYRGSPTYAKITNPVSYFRGFGLCTRLCGIFALVEARGPPTVPLMPIWRNVVFLKSQNPRNEGTLCNSFEELSIST